MAIATDRPTGTRRRIAIIGGGLSGAAMLCALLDSGMDCQVALYEPADEAGPGLAYGAAAPWHLLNVVASRASLVENDPDHLWRWAKQNGPALGWPDAAGCDGSSYLPRALYGRYIVAHMDAAMARSPMPVEHRRVAVTGIARHHDDLIVVSADGRQAAFDDVIFAVGAREATAPAIDGLDTAPLITDPWQLDSLRVIAQDASIFILGSALTMADTVLSLSHLGHRGPIHVLSRRGLVPEARREDPMLPSGLDASDAGQPLSRLLQRLRRAVKTEGRANWQRVFEGLRPFSNELWIGLSDDEKRRFQRHLRAFWDAHRFRMPPSTAVLLRQLADAGRLQFHKGRMLRIAGGEIVWQPRGTSQSRALRADVMIDCTGPRRSARDWKALLIDRLLEQGLLAPHSTGFGLAANAQGQALDGTGHTVPGLCLLGPPMRGVLLECSAITDIRRQAAALAGLFGRAQMRAAG